MTGWDERSLDGAASTVVLLGRRVSASGWPSPRSTPCCSPSPGPTCTAAPARWPSSPAPSACSAGLSLLTAVALRRFTAEVDAIGTPFELCPDTPADCAAYDAATDAAILTQLHTVFAGAAIAAGLAAVAAAAPAARTVRTASARA